ncbi:MAG: FprA family A-type flavoprotein, partial [Oscillospiraceae bacterium]|nr:FprA family A-type flavoprotein [Oscillospiraceae bacterium]
DRPLDYIVCNHVEPDHSGALPAVVDAYPHATVYGTANGQKELAAYYPDSAYAFVPVKAGDTLATGRFTLHFVPMPMVHWPDSMSTYLPEEHLLFSNDALGQHIGTGAVTDGDISRDYLLERAGDYYANIVFPYSAQVRKLLDAIGGLDVDIICPSHGVILENHVALMLQKYAEWCENKVDEHKTVIVYDTMWGTTEKIAHRLREEYEQKGCAVELIHLADKHYSYALSQLLEAKYIFVGSPTLNNQMMPSVSAFLTYMRGLRPKNRVGLAFGSYGWSGESVGQVHDALAACGFEILPDIKAQWNV